MSLLVDALSVSCFGGIRGTVNFDLSSPLTLIYAPNGTGKTSLIEAINWAFCSSDVRDARCRIADPASLTRVEMTVRQFDHTERFARTIDFDQSESRTIDDEPMDTLPYLKRMAPKCNVDDLHVMSQKKRLIEHLSDNRMLFSHTLTRLIDSDSAETRSEAMAELLGTRSQLNAIKQIDLYQKRVDRRLSELSFQVSDLEARKNSIELLESTHTYDLDKLTADVSALLRVPPEPKHLLNQLDLRALCSDRLSVLRSKLDASEKLARRFDSGERLEQLSELQKERDRLENSRSEIARSHSVILGERVLAEAAHAQQHEELENTKKLLPLAAELCVVTGKSARGAMWSELVASARDLVAKFGAPHLAKARLSDFEAKFKTWPSILNDLAATEVEIARASEQLSNLGEMEQLSAALTSIRGELLQVESISEDFEIARGRLIDSLHSINHALPENASCPACGHDWETHINLERAVERALAGTTLAAAAQAAKLSNLHGIERDLAAKVSTRSSLESNLIGLRNNHGILIAADSDIRFLASQFGVTQPSLDSDAIVGLSNRIKIAELIDAVSDLRSRASLKVRSPDPDESVESWMLSLDSYLENGLQDLASGSRKLESIEKAMVECQSRLNEIEFRIKNLADRLADAHTSYRSISALADQLGLAKADPDDLKIVQRELVTQLEEVGRANSLLDVRERSLEAQKRLADIANLDAQLLPLRATVSKIQKEQIKAAGVAAMIGKAASQIQKGTSMRLSPTISQLFQRMQVNRVFSEISVDDELHIHGHLTGMEIEPKLFSSGQRQDLALAFFLARSYAMSGSFFLDEPLAHLDDVNRVALLDTLRGFVLATKGRPNATRLTITTASWNTARHLIEKFSRIDAEAGTGGPYLRVYQLRGNVHAGVERISVYPLASHSTSAQITSAVG